MTVARLAGRWPGFHGPRGFLPWVAGTSCRWSGGLRECGDPGPGGGNGIGPGPGQGDFQLTAAAAAGQPGGGVQDPVAQGLWLGFGEVAVEGEQPEPGQQGRRGQRGSQPGGVEREVMGGELAVPQSFPVRMASSTRAWTRWAASM
jgi:hypothetical protein